MDDDQIGLRTLPGPEHDRHFPADPEPIPRSGPIKGVLQNPQTLHMEMFLRTHDGKKPIDEFGVGRKAGNPIKIICGVPIRRRPLPLTYRFSAHGPYSLHGQAHLPQPTHSGNRIDVMRYPRAGPIPVLAAFHSDSAACSRP
nr:hypothetical protein Ade03nite_65050 [Actinoplanes derwentensis]